MSFAINFIINHPSDANNDYCWDDFFQLQEPERKEVERSPLPIKKIGFPTTIAIPPSEISTSALEKTQKSPITPKLVQRNSKFRADEQELTRPFPIMNINKIATSEFPLNTPSEPNPVILMNSPKENPEKEGSFVDETQQDSEENPTLEKFVKRMRMELSVIPEFDIQNILNPDSFLDQDYFQGSIPQIQRKWTDEERVLLIRGIEKYGIGHYNEISDELLPDWPARDLCVKTMQLIGSCLENDSGNVRETGGEEIETD